VKEQFLVEKKLKDFTKPEKKERGKANNKDEPADGQDI